MPSCHHAFGVCNLQVGARGFKRALCMPLMFQRFLRNAGLRNLDDSHMAHGFRICSKRTVVDDEQYNGRGITRPCPKQVAMEQEFIHSPSRIVWLARGVLLAKLSKKQPNKCHGEDAHVSSQSMKQGWQYLIFISVWSLPRLFFESNQIANIQKSTMHTLKQLTPWHRHNVDVEQLPSNYFSLLSSEYDAPPLFMALLSSSRAANSSWQ